MGRPRGASNVDAKEVARIRHLYRKGVRISYIVEQVGRSESVVYRAVRGMKRKRPPPPSGAHAERNDEILALIEEGLSRAAVGKQFGLSATQVGQVVIAHPRLVHLLRVRRLKPAVVAKRYRLELSTAVRIAEGKDRGQVRRTRGGVV